MTRPGASGIRTQDFPLSRWTPYHKANEAVFKKTELFYGHLLSKQHAECMLRTDLLKNLYMLSCWDSCCRSNLIFRWTAHKISVTKNRRVLQHNNLHQSMYSVSAVIMSKIKSAGSLRIINRAMLLNQLNYTSTTTNTTPTTHENTKQDALIIQKSKERDNIALHAHLLGVTRCMSSLCQHQCQCKASWDK